MNGNIKRAALAIIATFYVVIGGLWATNYFPLKERYRQHDIMRSVVLSYKDLSWSEDPRYKKADEYITAYALTHDDVVTVEERISLLEAILIWGTVALVVGASVLFLTRQRPAR